MARTLRFSVLWVIHPFHHTNAHGSKMLKTLCPAYVATTLAISSAEFKVLGLSSILLDVS
jgi:hypothetical protein